MRLPLPGPLDLAHAVRDVAVAATSLGRAAAAAVELVPRLVSAVDRIEELLDRAEIAVARIEVVAGDVETAVRRVDPLLVDIDSSVRRIAPVVTQAESAVRRVDAVVTGAEQSVTRVDAVVTGAEQSVTRVDGVVQRAAGTVQEVTVVIGEAEGAVAQAFSTLTSAGHLVDGADALLAQVQGPLEHLLPVLVRMSETLSPEEVDAAVLLIDRLPVLLSSVDDDVLPLLRQLSGVGPELHELLRLVEDLHRMVAGLPGVRLLRRRGEHDEEHREATS